MQAIFQPLTCPGWGTAAPMAPTAANVVLRARGQAAKHAVITISTAMTSLAHTLAGVHE